MHDRVDKDVWSAPLSHFPARHRIPDKLLEAATQDFTSQNIFETND